MGCYTGVTAKIKDVANKDLLITLCILHQKNLFAKKISPESNVVLNGAVKIVNDIGGRALHPRDFEALCDSIGSQHPVLGTANLNSIPQPQIPQNSMRYSATANPQVCDRFAVIFRTSATANAHCTSANLDRNIYCYFVLNIQ